eukprot:scaffold13627_cov109-Isochrysis_galbana.AAC.5
MEEYTTHLLLSIYKVDRENEPFDFDPQYSLEIYTLKRFADLALALAHDARTKQLLAISRGEPPPSLNQHLPNKAIPPCHTIDEEAKLLFSSTLHDHPTEYDLAQYTVNRPQPNPITQTERIRQRNTEWIPEAGPAQDKHRRNRPVGSQWEP